jgi:hypothetical protein
VKTLPSQGCFWKFENPWNDSFLLRSLICKYNQITCHVMSNIHCNFCWCCWLVVQMTITRTQIPETLTFTSALPKGLILNLIIQISYLFQFKCLSSSLMGLQHSLSISMQTDLWGLQLRPLIHYLQTVPNCLILGGVCCGYTDIFPFFLFYYL